MAHNIKQHDSMLAVGERPWHGLGVTLKEPPATGEEALRIAKLDWTVHREALFLGNGRRAVVIGSVYGGNDGQYAAMVRDDTDHILGIVGPGYVEYQNSQMASLFNPLIENKSISIETCGSLHNGRRVWMLGRFQSGNCEIEKGDEVAKYLLLAHGHDGQFAVRFGATAVRVVCQNTLSLAMQKSRLMRCLHTTNLEDNLTILRDGLVAAEEAFELTADQYRLLASRGVSRADLREYARIVLDAPKEEKEWTRGQKDKIGKIIGSAMEGRGNTGRNWWHAYNGVTEYLSWQAGRKVDSRVESMWFGKGVEISANALELALSMSA